MAMECVQFGKFRHKRADRDRPDTFDRLQNLDLARVLLIGGDLPSNQSVQRFYRLFQGLQRLLNHRFDFRITRLLQSIVFLVDQ